MLTAHRQRGLTLIEALVVMSILAFVLAIGGPALASMFRNAGVRGQAEALQAGISKARSEALKRNQVVGFWLVTAPGTAPPDETCALASTSGAWVVSMDSPAGNCDEAPSQTVAPRIVETSAIASRGAVAVSALAANGSGASSVRFNGFGQVVTTGTPIATIDVNHASDTSSRRLRIQITTSGTVRLCDRDVTAPDTRACI